MKKGIQEELEKFFIKWEDKIISKDNPQFIIDFIQDNEIDLNSVTTGNPKEQELKDFKDAMCYRVDTLREVVKKKYKKTFNRMLKDLKEIW